MDAVTRIKASQRIVVKIGSALLVDRQTRQIRQTWLRALASDIAELSQRGTRLLIVSSGSIALGRSLLGFDNGALPLEQSQAAAASGQIRLARAYEEALAPHGLVAAQILLTLDDSSNRRRYLNSRATFENLLLCSAVPVVNENDTVATDEIRFGDNDRLAAQVAAMTNADCLVLLSDVDGLYDQDPRMFGDARRISEVPTITAGIEAMAAGTLSGTAKGGMRTKIQAAKTATSAGCATIIADGFCHAPLRALMDGAACTVFRPRGDPQSARKHWIASMKPRGRLTVDQGALRALKNGKSLLPAGITSVVGDFGRGDPVEICDPEGFAVWIGLARYTHAETVRILGKKSSELPSILGYPARSALVHRDDLVVLATETG
ncbi:MAG: glutamate 5-kinase [Rhodobacteraceae bacterium]|nr:glutamate 5-kinase [Paracoccaceae bacterium]